jgi:uncharacterized protein YciI
MKLDRFTISLLIANPDAPGLDAAAASAMPDAHMGHLADLHDAGALLISGPVLGAPAQRLRGVSILGVEPEEAQRINERDPAIRAGLYSIETYAWLVPSRAMSFTPARFPRSMRDVSGD